MSSEDAARYNKYWDTQETIAKQKQQINEFEEGIKKVFNIPINKKETMVK